MTGEGCSFTRHTHPTPPSHSHNHADELFLADHFASIVDTSEPTHGGSVVSLPVLSVVLLVITGCLFFLKMLFFQMGSM